MSYFDWITQNILLSAGFIYGAGCAAQTGVRRVLGGAEHESFKN